MRKIAVLNQLCKMQHRAIVPKGREANEINLVVALSYGLEGVSRQAQKERKQIALWPQVQKTEFGVYLQQVEFMGQNTREKGSA